MEPCGFSKGAASLKVWGDELFTWVCRDFQFVSPTPAANPMPPRNFPHVSSDLLLQIELSVPTFHFRGKRENGKNSPAFKKNSSLRCSKLSNRLFLPFHLF